MKSQILVVDDEPNIRRILQVAFEQQGWDVQTAPDGRTALALLESGTYDLVITDVTMPGMSGYELQREIHDRHPELAVVLMTAYGTIPQAIQAIRDGAFEFVTKPFDLEHLKRVVRAGLEDPAQQVRRKPVKRTPKQPQFEYVAESAQMKEVFETIEQVADSRATVLITGESGSGKEVAAKLIHQMSPRAAKPFVAVSCAALPESLLESELFGYEKGAFTGANGSKVGRFEMAHTGTLFLDEIGEIPMPIQVKLLRVLQEREFERLGATKPTRVDVRLVTATNRDLHEAVEQGLFRLDLLYRLQVVEIHLPALRERVEDIGPLALHFLRLSSAENGRRLDSISSEALAMLESYRWPGNVRELENTMERAVALAHREEMELLSKHLPPVMRRAA